MNTKELVNQGLNEAANIIKSTMGAAGKLVAYQKNGKTEFSKDGVTVAKNIKFKDYYKNIGCEVLVSAASKTVETAGDGTTATSVLAQALLNEFNKLSLLYDKNQLIDAFDSFVKDIVTKVKAKSTPLDTVEKVEEIATISANSAELGKLIREVYEQVGLNSLLSLEKSEDNKTTFEIVKGLNFETGFVHSSFKTNDTNCTLIEPNVFISDKACNSFKDFEDKFSFCLSEGQSILILAPNFSPDFIRACVYNKQQTGLQVCLVRTPGFGGGVDKNIEDIRAFLTKGDTVDKVVVTEQSLLLYNTDTPFLKKRVDKLKKLHEAAENKHDEQDYYLRMYKLQGKTAIVYAGGITEESMNEEYDRLDDALHAVKSAIRGGYVIGGGYCLLQLINESTALFSQILRAPAYTILENAGLNPDVIILQAKPDTQFNVRAKKFENFLETGIIDPTEVVTESLINSWAAVKLILNTSNILKDVED